MSSIRLGLIGAGTWARQAHLPSIEAEAVERVAVASRRHGIADELGFRIACGDWMELLEREDVDAVLVCTPPNLHGEQVHAALSRDKHVLCESPFAGSSAEAREFAGLARKRGVILGTTRPRPLLHGGERVRELLQQADEPFDGRLVCRGNAWLRAPVEATWRVRLDAGPSALAGLTLGIGRALFGPCTAVRGRLETLDLGSGVEGRAANEVVAELHFQDGHRLSIDAGYAGEAPPAQGLDGSIGRGRLTWDWSENFAITWGGAGSDEPERQVPPELPLAQAWPYTRRFLEGVRAGRPDEAGLQEAIDTLHLYEALLASTVSGDWVELSPLT